MRVSLILLSGGRGKRLEKNLPKALVKLNRRPLFYYSLNTMSNTGIFTYICVVVPERWKASFHNYITKYGLKVDCVVAGGKERVDSVFRGLSALPDCDYVFIHDSARPLVSRELIFRLYKSVLRYKAVIPVREITFTIKHCQRGFVYKTVDRSQLYEVQTPQAFSYSLLKSAIERYFSSKSKYPIWDDAYLVELVRKKVKTVPGEASNFKITFPEDLKLAERLI